jgi:hypothetical protein
MQSYDSWKLTPPDFDAPACDLCGDPDCDGHCEDLDATFYDPDGYAEDMEGYEPPVYDSDIPF